MSISFAAYDKACADAIKARRTGDTTAYAAAIQVVNAEYDRIIAQGYVEPVEATYETAAVKGASGKWTLCGRVPVALINSTFESEEQALSAARNERRGK